MIESAGGMGLDPWGTICKEAALERHWPTMTLQAKHLLCVQISRFVCCHSITYPILTNPGLYNSWLKEYGGRFGNWDQALSHNCYLPLVEVHIYSFFLGLAQKVFIYKGRKLKGCFDKRLFKTLYTNSGALEPRRQCAYDVWGVESEATSHFLGIQSSSGTLRDRL